MNCSQKKLLLSTAAILAGAVTNGALAQESVEPDDVIVVSGIRASVTESLDAKRNATEFVDAINAEDVGKLPDRNIAEALQRITGVTIQRNRGEGDFVSIRGLPPEFVRGTVNGRTFLSGTESFDSTRNGAAASTTGRATNFDILPSELVESLEVKKSVSASDIEGGIGGTVNLKTARPLTLGNTVVAVGRGRYSEFADSVDPAGFLMGSWSNGDDFGVLASINYTDRSIRQDISNNFLGYYPFDAVGAGALDLDADGVADSAQPFINLTSNPEIFEEQRERITGTATLQWEPRAGTQFALDFLYSKRDVETTQYGTILDDNFAAVLCAGPTSLDSSGETLFECPSAVVENNTLISRDVEAGVDALFTDARTGTEDTFNIGGHISHELSSNLSADIDVSYAETSGELFFTRVVGVLGGDFPASLQYTNDGPALIMDSDLGSTLSDPASYSIRQTELRNRFNDDSELGAKLDLTYSTDDSAIKAVKAGFHFRQREKSFSQFLAGDGGRADSVVPATTITDSLISAPENFFGGDYAGLSPSDLLFPNLATVVPARAAGFPLTPELETSTTFETEITTLAGYFQVDLDTEITGRRLTGNAGVRVVHTQQNVVGLLQGFDIVERAGGGGAAGGFNEIVFTGTTLEFPFEHDYLNFLPSLNLKLDVTDALVARFGYGRTLTRPEFEELAPALTITNPSNFFAASGNPTLDPYLADNIDLSLEWYFDRSSAFTVSFFHKQIRDFIVDSVATNIDVSEIGFVNDAGVRTQGVTLASVERQGNEGEASITGVEIGYTQVYDFLPSPFDGLGFQGNVTIVDSTLKNASTGVEQAFLGVSDLSFNLAGFYEKGPAQVRLAYTWRDDFLNDELTPLGFSERYTDSYGQLDFSAAYNVTDNVSVFVDGVNLTNEIERDLTADVGAGSPNPSRVVSAAKVGRRFSFGARVKF